MPLFFETLLRVKSRGDSLNVEYFVYSHLLYQDCIVIIMDIIILLMLKDIVERLKRVETLKVNGPSSIPY
jgi:hypothetical protein